MLSSHVIVGLTIIVCAYAQVSLSPNHIEKMKLNPNLKWSKRARLPRDVTRDMQEGHGLFGTPGYDGNVDGKAEFEAATTPYLLKDETYGSRISGYSSHMNGKLDETHAENADAGINKFYL